MGRCRVKFRFEDTASNIASQLTELLKDEKKRDGIISAVAAPTNLEENAPEHLIELIQTLSNPDMNLNIRVDLGQEKISIPNQLRGRTLFHIRDDRIAMGDAAIQDGDGLSTAAALSGLVVLRPELNPPSFWHQASPIHRMVGLAYLEEIMEDKCLDVQWVEEILQQELTTFTIW